MDEDFLRRVRKASVVMGALVALCGCAIGGPVWALAFALAAAWSIVNLWVLERLLTVLMQRRSRVTLAAIFCLKVPVLYGLILLYLLRAPWQPSSLLSGISLPYAVIVLKAVGRSLVEATGRRRAPKGLKETPQGAGAEKQQDRTLPRP